MQRRFDKIIEGLLPAGETALLAVSGGVDSICLAELFAHSTTGRRFAVAHCNFHLRSAESDGDELLVRKWAETAGVRLHKADFDTLSYASEHSISVEMAARELRYDFFADVCKEYGYWAAVVAHNANDNAETLMLNLLRGTGLKGLAGMRQCSTVPVTSSHPEGVRLLRPLLAFSRAEIEEYAVSAGLEWREDHTNAETIYKRNRIRHNVFPVFESVNPSFLRTFSREMSIFSEAGDIAEDYFAEASGRVRLEPCGAEVLRVDTEVLRREKHWHYVLFRLLEPFGFRWAMIEDLCGVMESGTYSGHVLETSGYRLVTAPGRFSVTPCGAGVPKPLTLSEDTCCSIVRTAGRYEFDGRCVEVGCEAVSRAAGRLSAESEGQAEPEGRDAPAGSDMPADPVRTAVALSERGAVAADAGALKYPFLLRGWRRGDWMRPVGLGGRKKLSDLFTGLGLDAVEKAAALVVVIPALNEGRDDTGSAGEHIAAVCGYASGRFFARVDESVKVTGTTENMIVIRQCGGRG